MNKVNSNEGLELTEKQKKQRGIVNKVSQTEEIVNRNFNYPVEDFNNEHEITTRDAIFYFNRATLRLLNGDLDGARSDFKMSEQYDRDHNGESSNYPVF